MELHTNGGGCNMLLKQQQELFKIVRQAERQDVSLQAKFKEVFNFIDHNFKARHEPEPPKLRPMSELPEGNSIVFLAVLENDAGFRFLEVLESNEYLYQGAGVDYTFTKKENFQNEHFKLIGWLYELPNPNDIKL